MTFNPLMGLMVARVVPEIAEPRTVCEFGNQRLRVDEPTYRRIGMKRRPKTTKEFYRELGFQVYTAIDVNTEMNAVVGDLNEPLGLAEHFALVTNNGTGEHIFDQAAVFRSAHDLCRIGGVMLHVLPFTPWLNHGFYNFNPILFRDLAAANEYEVLFLRLATRWGVGVDITGDWAFQEKDDKRLLSETAGKGNVSTVAAYRKIKDQPFRKPVQGKYLKDIASAELAKRYRA